VSATGAGHHRDLPRWYPSEPVPKHEPGGAEPSAGSLLEGAKLEERRDKVGLVVQGDDAGTSLAVRAHPPREDHDSPTGAGR